MIPNHLADVKRAQLRYADAWSHAHMEGDPRRLEWIKLFAIDLHAVNAACYLNGKRGNPLDLSADAINILVDKEDSAGRTPGGLACVVVDVIGGAGGSNPTPAWNVYNTLIEGSGAPVDPNHVPAPKPTHIPYPGDSRWDAVGAILFADYRAAGQEPNAAMGRWFGRVIWDAVAGDEHGKVWTISDSITKHRPEWQAVLGQRA